MVLGVSIGWTQRRNPTSLDTFYLTGHLTAFVKERSAAATKLAAARFRREPKCVDRTAGSSSDISGLTIAFPNLNVLLPQSVPRCHSALPFPVSSEQRIRSCWDRSSFV